MISKLFKWHCLACLAAALFIILLSAPATSAQINRPPELKGSSPGQWFNAEGVTVRYGKEIRFNLIVTDADGDPMSCKAEGLPQGARFDADIVEFTWTPREEDLGDHRIKFMVSDGKANIYRVSRIIVVENRAPIVTALPKKEAASGRSFELALPGQDPDGDSVTYSVDGLPRGAELDAKAGKIRWTPADNQTGTHTLKVRASDGQLESQPMTAQIEVVEEWRSIFLPGAYFTTYFPNADETLGWYRGAAVEVAFYTWVHRNDNRGPSHGRAYIKGQILDSSEEDAPITFIYSLGAELSVERNPHRRFLLPFFGLDVGGISQDNLGQRFQVTPQLGVYVWYSRNIFITLIGGYVIAPTELETLRGWTAALGGNFTLW